MREESRLLQGKATGRKEEDKGDLLVRVTREGGTVLKGEWKKGSNSL